MTKDLISRRAFNATLAAGAALTFLPGTGRAAVKITAAEAVETMYYLPLYAAKAKGFFEEEGLDVEIFNAQQRTIALRAIVSGDAFTYNGDPAEPAIGRQRGVACKNIGVLVDRAVQVVLAKKGMSKDPKDWKGEKIIIPRPPHNFRGNFVRRVFFDERQKVKKRALAKNRQQKCRFRKVFQFQ